MRLPRDLSGEELARLLRLYKGAEHHITIPAHSALKVGTLSSILNDENSSAGDAAFAPAYPAWKNSINSFGPRI